MSLDIDKEDVIPFLASRWSRFNAGHADTLLGQWLQQTMQNTGPAGRVIGRHHQRCLVRAARRQQISSNHEKARRVIGPIFNIVNHYPELIDVGGNFRANRRSAILISGSSGTCRIAGHADQLDMRQVLAQPATTLRQGLFMGADSLNLLQTLHLAHQVLLDFEFDFARYLKRRRQEHIQGVIHRPFCRVFDRHHAEIGGTALDFLKDLIDRMER